MRLLARHLAVLALAALSGCLDRTPGTVGQIADVSVSDSDSAPFDAVVTADISVVSDTADAEVGTAPTDVPVTASPGCPALPSTPQVLVQEDYWVMQPSGVTGRDGVVYFGAELGYYQDEGYKPDGRVFRIPADGDSYELLDSEHTYIGRRMAINERHLAYYSANVQSTGAQSWAFTYPAVVLRDLESGAETLVGGQALGWESIRDFELLPDSRVASVQSSSPFPDGPSGHLTVYDPDSASYTTTTYADFRWMTGFGAKVAAYVHVSPGQGITMGGDVAAELAVLETNDDFHCCRMMGADEGGIYQRRGDTIEALPWDGSPAQVLATGVQVDWIFARSGRVLYWVEHDEVWAVSTVGGSPTKIATTQTGYIEALGADRCGVYFSANNYPRLMVMAAPQLAP